MDLNNQEIIFPVEWQYRIIVVAKSEPQVIEDIQELIKFYGVHDKISYSHASSSGTYKTYSFKKLVNSKEEMNEIATKIADLNGVKVVI